MRGVRPWHARGRRLLLVVRSSCRTPSLGKEQVQFLSKGAPLAGGSVIEPRGTDEYVVQAPDGGTWICSPRANEPPSSARRAYSGAIGGRPPFARPLHFAREGASGSLVLPAIDGARSLADAANSLGLSAAFELVARALDAARVIERLGFAWEPLGDDFYVRADGSLYVSRVRAARRLVAGERLDARMVVEVLGPPMVYTPLGDGPPRALRLLMPHVSIAGDRGSTIEDVSAELNDVLRELELPADDGSRVAGVCDPGLRRAHNEDAFARASGTLRGERWTVLVVCDGVSSSSHADQASAIAAKSACDALAHFVRAGDIVHEASTGAVRPPFAARTPRSARRGSRRSATIRPARPSWWLWPAQA